MKKTLFIVASLAAFAGLAGATVTYNTNAGGTGFGGVSLTLNSSSGQTATLVYTPDGNTIAAPPSNIDYGRFTLSCPNCTTEAGGLGAVFPSFTFDLIITDVTDSATGVFVGTGNGGTVFTDQSPISISWAPLQLGPGTTNASTGNFGPDYFSITSPTGIVAITSGGVTTVQGFINSTAVPEPATFGMLGAALVGLGFLARKRKS